MLLRSIVLLLSVLLLFARLLGQTNTDQAAAERLFRQKCFRCHDASLTLRPVPPARIDSLVCAMRRYDTLWINTREADMITRFMKQRAHNSPLPSQSKKRSTQ